MSVSNYYQNLISHIAQRSVEATISILGITDQGLREHLQHELSGDGFNLGLLAEPVFEAMFPWEKSSQTMGQLSGGLIQASLIDAMDRAEGHRFGKEWYPFKHQLQAWHALSKDFQKSLVVTSGTGSGKTECFMVPILNDLVSEYEQNYKALVGVRALFIYPLNALINSQQERLRAWTEAYEGGLRFCLYNGNTEENKHKDQNKYPNEVLTRKTMRESPAPMLVTNATMLEYMLVRQIDEPIIKQSSGKLRWIVLDEAHSYIGSQAAELSLLLRRVMHAFGVEAKNVRFVATSATIGDDDSKNKLQEYLANLSGVSVDQVVVVGGKRSVPVLPKVTSKNLSLEDIVNIDNDNSFSVQRYESLVSNAVAMKLRKTLTEKSIPNTLSSITKSLFGNEVNQKETLAWIDVCSNTSKPGPNPKNLSHDAYAFLPVRAHLFHQVLTGLWCCADKNCLSKKETPLSQTWPFGRVYSQRRNNCECGSPLFELLFCNDCNAPHLLAVESSGYLVQMDRKTVDEFSLDYESSDENESEAEMQDSSDKVIISPKKHQDLTYTRSINAERRVTPASNNTLDLNIISPENICCVCCEHKGFKAPFYRRSLLGTPFYISNNIPALLDACNESEEANERPNRGRRLITFTDSRQGTARISTKIQQDSERDCVRGLIYSSAAHNVTTLNDIKLKELHEEQEKYLKQINQCNERGDYDLAKSISELFNGVKKKLDNSGNIKALTWNDAVTKLHASQDISRWIFDYYKNLNPQLFPESGGARVLTEMLLLREFARRPKRQNSLETLGMVSVQYPALNQIQKVPDEWKQLELTLSDWINFLKVILDFYVRENTIIDIPHDWVDWMGAKIYPKSVLKPDSNENTSTSIRRWPQVVQGRNGRLVRMLCLACDLNLKNPAHKDKINGILKAAWHVLTEKHQSTSDKTNQPEVRQILRNLPGTVQFHLSREEMAFQSCTKVWICPVTHRLLDSTFKGITPYLPFNANKDDSTCTEVELSVCQVDSSHFKSDIERKHAVREWIGNQSSIQRLRKVNLWTDISDRVVDGGRFCRAAEHSAQQPASKLKLYEAQFKEGKINVLSCSTTMEMGVDIGGISVVAMNNVPPHPANYLQRSGRAGRRGETQAISFTICKDNPHERGVFVNPLWPFTTSIAAPYITLNSERIIQRHINSLMLSYFLKEVLSVNEISLTSLNCQWFFTGDDVNQAPVARMLRWLDSFKYEQAPDVIDKGIKQIVHGSILAGISLVQITNRSMVSLSSAKEQWLPGYELLRKSLEKLESSSETDPYKRKISYDLKCMGEEYLLSELASRAFLPGYGFPTGIATFDHYSVSDFKHGKYVKKSGRIDNLTRMRERPSRDMAVAIREYVPGSDIVLDGLVYHSAGILINKFSPNEDYSQPQRMFIEWRCHKCGFIGNESGSTFNEHCSDCGAVLERDHIKEYVEPIGFAVDFYSSPSIDISSPMYVPAKEPWVTANAPVNLLFEPRLGAYRNSTQGHIFNHTSGEHGMGFAVCLRCGRAESMTIVNDFPDRLQFGKPHKKLQGKPGPEASAWCEGPDEAYAIKASVHLGATDQTDVFELYLKNPSENNYLSHHKNDPLPWTLAVVLRQVLADIHGISAEEMGYAVKPATLPDCNYPVAAIVLYDKNGGGAGFSSAAPRYLYEMLIKAFKQLDCVEECDSACQSCLMGYDTRFHIDLLNRHIAIEYINKILPYLDVPPEAKLFGDSSKYCFESLGSEILSCATQGANELRLYVSGPFSDWDISSSGLKDACLSWRNNFKIVQIILPNSNISSLSDMHKEDLMAISNLGIKLSIQSEIANPILSRGSILAQVLYHNSNVTYASNAPSANSPNNNWWKLDEFYLVKSSESKNITISDLNRELLKTNRMHGDIEIEISSECDGLLSKFGDKLWDEMTKHSDLLKSSMSDSIVLKKISYSDCYVSSPWALMLLAEIIDSLRSRLKDKWDSPGIDLLTGEKEFNPHAKGLYAEWRSSADKSKVITEYFSQLHLNIDVDIKPLKEVPHGRILALIWSDASVSYIRLDHGIGCWSIDGRPHKWLDIEGMPKDQVNEMRDMRRSIRVKYGKGFPTQIFLKKR